MYFNWRIITLQYCDGFWYTSWINHRYACVPHPEPPSHLSLYPIPLSCCQAPTLGALLPVLNLHWSSILHTVICMFQCYSLKVSHSCFSHIVQKSVLYICVSFAALLLDRHYCLCKFHIYALIYSIGVSLSYLLHSIIGSSFIHLIRTDTNVFFFIAE